MGKQNINKLISNLKKSSWTTKISPWLNEQGLEVRYVGIRPQGWEEILSDGNNLLLKISIQEKGDFVEVLFANKPPFITLHKQFIDKETKWEQIMGSVRFKLGKDKQDYQKGNTKIDNLYRKILPQLKK